VGYYMAGDYYAGDPFLGGFVKAIGKGLGRIAKRFAGPVLTGIPGVGPLAAVGLSLASKRQTTKGFAAPMQLAQPAAFAGGRRRSSRMNYLNLKALKRASRRKAGFVKYARVGLEGTPFMVVSRSSRAKGRAAVSKGRCPR